MVVFGHAFDRVVFEYALDRVVFCEGGLDML